MTYTRKLSRRLRFIDHEPQARIAGDLLFMIEMRSGVRQWARVRGSRSRRSWWAEHILQHMDAVRVEEIP